MEQSSSVVYVVHGSRERELATGADGPARFRNERERQAWRDELDRRRRERTRLAKRLRELTDLAGGRLVDASAAGVQEAFVRVLSEMRSRYLLIYRPSGVSRKGWHTIELELQNLKGDVIFRRGYFYGPR